MRRHRPPNVSERRGNNLKGHPVVNDYPPQVRHETTGYEVLQEGVGCLRPSDGSCPAVYRLWMRFLPYCLPRCLSGKHRAYLSPLNLHLVLPIVQIASLVPLPSQEATPYKALTRQQRTGSVRGEQATTYTGLQESESCKVSPLRSRAGVGNLNPPKHLTIQS